MTEQAYLYTDTIFKKPVPRTPVWIMRQAGRYLPEYKKVRDNYDFLTVCKTPELAAEVTLQPIRRFGFDAAILFSDILVVPEALGQKLEFLENHGPRLSPQILSETEVQNLDDNNLEERLSYVEKTVSLLRRELPVNTPLIGFSGSPFTLAVYMIEGKPTRNFKYIKSIIYKEPALLINLLDKLSEAVTRYLIMQIKAGAQAIQIFDTWGGILPIHLFEKFSADYMKRIVGKIKAFNVPVTLFSRGGISLLKKLRDSGADMLGVDWLTDIAEARKEAGDIAALQGNLDPATLYGSKEIISGEIDRILNAFGRESGHVFNLGHGILPDTPVDNVSFLVDYVWEKSTAIRNP
ncbi:MAG: uroporphyrinogen decarboxylase [Calditrichaceae bacterium]|nr:uroporphyrinogen decarboxylase [Calditrichaceae bacterium]MBN2709660.1 uroporphyrinogen decarboxylase [Calditrichaceae bacterium]RQV95019.1 MAG: uroporphyrinogen decarboxylase [Calditrichota bacterium]